MTIPRPKPMVLIILDGWGSRAETTDNAIAAAHTPHWDALLQDYPHTELIGSGRCVGLPEGQMGNSEVGHLSLGLGRVIDQDYTRINEAIRSGAFQQNPALRQAILTCQATHTTLHVMGLLSPGGVHAHENHTLALIDLAAELHFHDLIIHAFLDGRDTPPQSAEPSLRRIHTQLECTQTGKLASICGRYYAMDRDQRWERVEQAYTLLVEGKAPYQADTPETALAAAYQRGETDEFVCPTIIGVPTPIRPSDSILFMNFRADRSRELCYALTDPTFQGFSRKTFPVCHQLITLTAYADDLKKTKVAFLPQPLSQGLGEILSQQGLTQLRLAETEKYAHVTFFFNGGMETVYPGEQRILIPSPKVDTYDQQPEMSAYPLTETLCQAIESQAYDLIVCNFANADMVGHTGNFSATVKAIEAIDTCLGRIRHSLHAVNGECLITADHGNAEYMYDPATQQPHTAHTTEPVPLIYIGRPALFTTPLGKLADVAPTLLYLMGLTQPPEMTGHCLLTLKEPS